MTTVTLARHAMASRFELILHGEDAGRLRAAGEEALGEVERIEAQLSLFIPTSEVAHINARASLDPVRVSPPVFALLEQARALHAASGGAFDITIAPLVRLWGFMHGTPRRPDRSALDETRARVGMDKVILDAARFEVRFQKSGMMIDLGAIGKGYAVEQAIDLLREAGIQSALLHGGTSTVATIGAPPDASAWKIGIENPATASARTAHSTTGMHRLLSAETLDPDKRSCAAPLVEVELSDTAFSVSSPGGKYFTAEGQTYGHVLDPRTGEPTNTSALAAVALPSATETDALSTALLVLGKEGVQTLAAIRPGLRAWVF